MLPNALVRKEPLLGHISAILRNGAGKREVNPRKEGGSAKLNTTETWTRRCLYN